MKEIYTEIEINASASVVWNIITNFDDFSRWNPFIRKISGKLQEGAQIEAFIKPLKICQNSSNFDAVGNVISRPRT